jgi:hypothetical protein
MPAVTRFAADNHWAFTVVNAVLCLVAIGFLRRRPEKAPRIVLAAACGLGLGTWVAMFGYCYVGFTGPMCLHHEPEFDLLNFLAFGGGVFPVTLAVLAALGGLAFGRWAGGKG